MKKNNLLFTLFMLFIVCTVHAQVTGIISDENGNPMFPATVAIEGTSKGVTTDINGQFSIDANEGDVLVISYVGYEDMKMTVDSRSNYDINMASGVDLDLNVTVVGSRGKPRTDVERPVPVDVVTAKELQVTGQTDLGQMAQFTSPSFNSAKYGVNGTTNYADPASLRGMGPDQSLVLVNGKRRHQFSTLNLNVAPGLGNVVTDLNSIPSGAVKRMEVLRDGAAAQYGSDAIAGIINLALQDRSDGGTFITTAGYHNSTPSDDASDGRHFKDGATFKNSLNYGFDLGVEGSYLNFTLEHFKFAGTNRSDYYSGTVYPTDSTLNFETYGTYNPTEERGVYPQEDFVVGNFGSNENETRQAFANIKYPIGTTGLNVYAFGGYSQKEIVAYGFFRNPGRYSRAVLSVYPDGYVPISPGVGSDYSFSGGISRELEGEWNFDLSYTKGHNRLYLDIFNTTNPSYGSATPTFFHVGTYNFDQNIINADVSKNLGEVGGIAGLNVAFGAAYRTDKYFQTRGSEASYTAGPLAAEGKDVGSSARPGIADENELSRSNVGVYADVEADITEALLVAAAARYENYSDFGGNISGKLAARYKLTDDISVRGSYNRGFRAPSVSQLATINNTSTVQNGVVVITRQVPSSDERLAQLGIEDPDAEISNNFNLGLTAKFGSFLFTADAYRITIDERIVITERLRTDRYPAVGALFPDSREIRFFTNHADTRTQGIDVVASYKKTFGNPDGGTVSRLNLSVAATFSNTEVTGQKETPAEILAGADEANQGLLLLGQTATELIEVAVPRDKLLLSAIYSYGDWGVTARTTRFGNVQAFSNGLSAEDSNVVCNDAGRCVQTFAPKFVTDLSVSHTFNKAFTLTLGSNNIFDVYPDKYNTTRNGFAGTASSYASGQIPYSRNSNQFGFNGRYLYLTGTVNF